MSDSTSSRKLCGRKTTLFLLFFAEVAAVVLLYYATTISFATFHYSIAKATLTLTSTYKILGISGGPIAGKVNGYRRQLLTAHQIGYSVYAFGAVFYICVQVVQHIADKRAARISRHRSYCDMFSKLVYFVCVIVGFGVSMIGTAIWICSWRGLKISGVSFDVQDGSRYATYAACLIVVVQSWRGLYRGCQPSRGERLKKDLEKGESDHYDFSRYE